MVIVILVPVGMYFMALILVKGPEDLSNLQGRPFLADSKTRWRKVNIKTKIESIEELFDIPINVVNNLYYGERK